ncbi:hypothetical protein [Streptomyces albipurpureus]|uniref:Uncharacterized protein n=1 Tax=Streptomyces albipurpureus TaxID=2897419 RepID=A0ABT0UHZ9_9ACTN|nr:hypothetical protein [Streptomyces sp. CWNU-1]MCM2388257.1 hypothetical protein [Streptomyces sp. CWNU-1]
MPIDAVARFLAALSPEHREEVSSRPGDEQERLAAAWEAELEGDDLDTLDELSPPAAESEAARRIVEATTPESE